jgi:hypothetical protein
MVTPEGRILAGCLRYLQVRGWREIDGALREAEYADDGPLFEGINATPYGEA